MRTLSHREKIIVRLGVAVIAGYVVFFVIGKPLDRRRVEYQRLAAEAKTLSDKARPYQDRVMVVKKLMENFHMDPMKLSKATVVGEASVAIQKAASGSGIQVGQVRENFTRTTGKELASLQFEGTGPLPAVIGLLSRLESLGYPLAIDLVQITAEASRPGQVKITMTILVLNFEAKPAEAPHA